MSRCDACPGPTFDQIQGNGLVPSPFFLVGAGPGKSEDRKGLPYVGLAGEELDATYLPTAGLRREDVFVSNAMMCWSGTNKTPTAAACLTCALTHLPRELDRVRPEVVVLMGGAVQGLSDTRVRLEMQHGIPFWGSVLKGAWEGWVVSMYEPALGMRETSRMSQLLDDFRQFGKWVRGEWTAPTPPAERPKHYELLHGEINGVRGMLGGGNEWVAVDTETDGGKPWSVQWSSMRGTGYMLLASDQRGLDKFEAYRREYDPEVILHNAPGDLDTLDRMGIHVTRWRDTMQEAYHLASLPQGLKPLAFRLLGVTMRSWQDVVWPASISALSNWMEDGIGLAQSNLQEAEVTYLKMGVCINCGKRGKAVECKVCGEAVSFTRTEYKPGAAQAVLRHVLTHTAMTVEDDEPYDPWKALGRMRVEGLRGKIAESWEWDYLEGELGPSPILSIANADLESAKMYAIGDADFTGQIAVELERLRGDKRWEIAEEDADV